MRYLAVSCFVCLLATACGSSLSTLTEPGPKPSSPASPTPDCSCTPSPTPSPTPPAATHIDLQGVHDMVSGVPMQLTVHYLDANDNLVDDGNVTVALALIGNGTLSGTLEAPLSNGVAEFVALQVSTPGLFSLHATAGALSVDSDTFQIKNATWELDPRNLNLLIAEASSDGNHLVGYTLDTNGNGNDYVSHDGGHTWTTLEAAGTHLGGAAYDCSQNVCDVGVPHLDKTDPNIVYVGEFTSVDGGANFTDTSYSWYGQDPNGTLYGRKMTLDTNVNSTADALWRSTDHGQTWSILVEAFVSELAGFASDPNSGSMCACRWPGQNCFISADGGATFQGGGTLLQASNVTAERLLADPTRSGVLYADSRTAGLFQSADFGATWSPFAAPADTGPVAGTPWALALTNPSRLYIIGNINSADMYDPARAWVTDDAGMTWTKAGWGLPMGCIGIAVDSNDPQTLYTNCPGPNGFKLYVTHTGGM